MAYLDQEHTHKRVAGIAGVAVIHVALAFGLVAGLAIKGVLEEDDPPLVGSEFDVPPPPPPPDELPQTPEPLPFEAPTAPVPPIALRPPVVIDITPAEIPDNRVLLIPQPTPQPRPAPVPQPRPSFAPKAPSPTNGPSGWVSNDDYPSAAVRREQEGTATYALLVGTDGKVDDCRITRSTGFEALDQATCRYIARRARFDPATDSSGAEVSGTYNGTITWQIPE